MKFVPDIYDYIRAFRTMLLARESVRSDRSPQEREAAKKELQRLESKPRIVCK